MMRYFPGLAALLFSAATPQALSAAPLKIGPAEATVPAGWEVTHLGPVIRVQPPGEDLRVYLSSPASGAAPRAVIASLVKLDSTCNFPIETTDQIPVQRGFDTSTTFGFRVPPTAHRLVYANILSIGSKRVATFLCADFGAYDRLSAATNGFGNSIQLAGWKPEDFSRTKPRGWTAANTAAIRQYLTNGMRSLNVPGAAFALIQNGRIVHEEGLGVRTLGSKLPVDAHTRFLIASNSKGMATLLLAKMVGEGKLRWDQPVSQLMPAIRLADPEASRKLQVRHLICACTGLPRADLESYFVDPAADSRLALSQLAMLKPTSAFGEQYQYSNTLAGVAGILAGHVADPKAEPLAAFSRAMHDEIWAPLGMNDTDFGDPRTQSGNFATGYLQDVDGRLVPVEQGLNATILPYRATGSGISSAHDVALYVANELNEGRLADGRQLVDRTALLARRQHGVSTGRDSWYGMGLMQRRVGGVEYLYHGGYMSGYHSQWIALPGTGLGAVLLTSSDNAFPLVANFPRRVLELIYSAQPIAVARLTADAGAQRKSIAASVRQLSPARGPAAALASAYAEPLLGTVDVQRTPKGVRFDFGPWGSKMMAKADPGAVGGYDFVAIADGYNQPATFVPGREADGTRTLILSDAQHRYVYRERR